MFTGTWKLSKFQLADVVSLGQEWLHLGPRKLLQQGKCLNILCFVIWSFLKRNFPFWLYVRTGYSRNSVYPYGSCGWMRIQTNIHPTPQCPTWPFQRGLDFKSHLRPQPGALVDSTAVRFSPFATKGIEIFSLETRKLKVHKIMNNVNGCQMAKNCFWNLQPSGTLVQPSGTKWCFDAPDKSFFRQPKGSMILPTWEEYIDLIPSEKSILI